MITAQQAFGVFKEINSKAVVTASVVYWEAIDAERWGHISISEMDAITIYHKDAIVQLWADEQDYIEREAREQSEVHKAQSDYWEDYENGEFD